MNTFALRSLAVLPFLALAACGGGGGGGGTPTSPTQYSIGGTITGLNSGATLVLQVNGGNNLSVTTNGSFTFATPLATGTSYSVSVLTQPTNQNCTVANGSGTVAAGITSIAVSCVTAYSIGGTLSGLSGTVVLRNNGGDDLTLTVNGAFSFANRLTGGTSYAVTVRTQPTGQNCTVAGGTGTANASVTSVIVACTTTPTYSVGGLVSGLTGSGLALTVNAGSPLAVPAGASGFVFPTRLLAQSDYQVKVTAQPAGQACTVANGRSIIQADVSSVVIACTNNTTSALAGTYALQGTNDYLTFFPDGTYVHATRRADSACGLNSGNGVEYGVYSWSQGSGALSFVTAAVDTNGSCGFWNSGAGPGAGGTLARTGTGSSTVLTFTPASGAQRVLQPVANTAGALVGAFNSNKSPDVLLFTADGRFLLATTQTDAGGAVLISAGIDYGCYSATGTSSGVVTITRSLASCAGAVTTTGLIANLSGSEAYALPDAITLNLGSGQTAGTWNRVQPN